MGRLCFNAAIFLLHLLVALEVADVVASSGHLPGVDGCLSAEPGDVAAGGIHAAAFLDAFLHEPCVLPRVVVEGRAAPMGLGRRRLLGHAEDAVVLIYGNDAALQQPLFVLLPEAHDAGGLLLVGIAYELYEAEVQEVVACDDQHVVVEMEFVDGELYVA